MQTAIWQWTVLFNKTLGTKRDTSLQATISTTRQRGLLGPVVLSLGMAEHCGAGQQRGNLAG